MSSGSYRGKGADVLYKHSVLVGDTIAISTSDGEEMEGVLMPRYESASDRYIVIKLKSGYNTGIDVTRVESIKKIADTVAHKPAKVSQSQSRQTDNALPKIALISTGGTIASKIDYRTGGVRAALSASELYASVPELTAIASVDPEVLMSEYSENLVPGHWTIMANKIAEKVATGKYDGIIVSHGTDTMHYTAAALSFALQGLPIPVVLVGAQRSSDRPSSDAALNLIAAATFAVSAPLAGVFVAMHANTSDDAIAIHIGTRVRKNHTSRRNAFESIDTEPVALVKDGKVEMRQKEEEDDKKLSQRHSEKLKARPSFDSRVALVKYYPGIDPTMVYGLISSGCRAIIFEGTGLGHVNKNLFGVLREAEEKGVHVFMTSQCIWGRVSMTVYDTGRDLLDIGVIPLSDMLSETATVKAMWALANTQDLKKIMQQNIAGEILSAIPI